MKIIVKNITAVLLTAALLFAAFFASYKITVSVRTNDDGESTSDDAALVANTAAPTDVSTEPQDVSAAENTSAEENTTLKPSTQEALPVPEIINIPTDETWCTVLLNVHYKMNDTYEPFLEEAIAGTGIYLDERVAVKFLEMYNAALADGVTLTPASGYVSADRQTRNFTKQCELYTAQGYTEQRAQAAAAFTVLPAGCSEHNYGLAVDIGWKSQSFAESPAYAWLKEHAEAYGFIERYKAEKEEITEFNAAPYHWRYVGVDAARAINDGGYCLEEYLGKIN